MEQVKVTRLMLPPRLRVELVDREAVARAQRRAAEGQADAVAQRDLLDSTRATAPLVCPEGATRIDNTHLTLGAVVAQVKALVQHAARRA